MGERFAIAAGAALSAFSGASQHNLNQRSMAVDSEINLATNDARHATSLRKRIWLQLATEKE